MITGVVTAAREAVLQVHVQGPAGQTTMEAVLDTGFTGFLTLPLAVVMMLGLPFAGTSRATLSDGSEVGLDVFEATVLWDGRHARALRAQLAATKCPSCGSAGLREDHLGLT